MLNELYPDKTADSGWTKSEYIAGAGAEYNFAGVGGTKKNSPVQTFTLIL